MAKGPLITQEVVDAIGEIYLEHTDWAAKQVQQEVQDRLKAFNQNMPENWPSISAIQERLKKLRHNDKLTRKPGFDDEWNMMTLRDFEIPAEAIPTILKARFYLQLYQVDAPPLTIRQAKWISRLYKLIDIDKDIADIFVLIASANTYAFFDHLSELDDTIRQLNHDEHFYNHITSGKKIPGVGDIYSLYPGLKAKASVAIKEAEHERTHKEKKK